MVIEFYRWLRIWINYQRLYRYCVRKHGNSSLLAKSLAVHGLMTTEEVRLLHELAGDIQRGCIVEIGSYHGKSTAALAQGAINGGKAQVYAIDPYKTFTGPLGGKFGPHDRARLLENLLLAGVAEHVALIHLTSEQASKGWQDPISLLWIDGDHSYHGVKTDFESWDPFVIKSGLVAFHDSLDPLLGPNQLIGEILETGFYEQTRVVDKITVLQKRT